jgi:protein O-mannosyl-transferase
MTRTTLIQADSMSLRHVPSDSGRDATSRHVEPRDFFFWRALCLGSTLFVLILLVYWLSFSAQFIWDDDYYVTENHMLRDLAGLWRIWLDPRATPQYYPLVHTTFWVEYHLWGLHPKGYHLVNVLLHAANTVLVAVILLQLKVPGAWLASAIFGLHPVHVESVTWVTERKNVLSTFFYLLALLQLLNWWGICRSAYQHNTALVAAPKLRLSQYLGGSLLFAAALLSKSVTCSLPAVLLLILWQHRGHLTRRDAVFLTPLFTIGFLLAMNTIWLERTNVGASGTGFQWTFAERILIAGNALWFYAIKLVCPMNLAFIYPRWWLDVNSWLAWCVSLSAGLFPLLMVLRSRKLTAPLVAVLFFMGTLFPALGFFNIYPMRYSYVADHFQYLASVGLISLVAASLVHMVPVGGTSHGTGNFAAWFGRGWMTILWDGVDSKDEQQSPPSVRRSSPADVAISASTNRSWRSSHWLANAHFGMSMVVLSGLACLTWQRQSVFQTPQALWQDTLAKNPTCMVAHIQLGKLAVHAQDYVTAERHFRDVERYRTDDIGTHCNEADLGVALAGQKRYSEAVAMFQAALDRVPNYFEALNGWGMVAAQQGHLDTAISLFERSLKEKPNQAFARRNLGMAFLQAGRLDDADRELRRTLTESSADCPKGFIIPIYFMLTQILARKGQLIEAEKSAQVLLQLDPTSPSARNLFEQIEQDLRQKPRPMTKR